VNRENCEKRLLASSCLSVRPHGKRGSNWTDFHEVLYLSIFGKKLRKFKFHENLTRVTGTLHEDQHEILIISRSVLLRIRNVSAKVVEKIEKHILCAIFFFSGKPCRF